MNERMYAFRWYNAHRALAGTVVFLGFATARAEVTFTPISAGALVEDTGLFLDLACGHLDLIVTNGAFGETPESCEYYRNDGGTNNWLALIGVASNRSAITSALGMPP